MKREGGSFFTFIIGIIVGGILGILYAPDEGKNTRDRLSYKLDKVKKQLEDFLQEIIEGKQEINSEAKDKGKQVVRDAKNKAEKLLDDVNGLIKQIKKD